MTFEQAVINRIIPVQKVFEIIKETTNVVSLYNDMKVDAVYERHTVPVLSLSIASLEEQLLDQLDSSVTISGQNLEELVDIATSISNDNFGGPDRVLIKLEEDEYLLLDLQSVEIKLIHETMAAMMVYSPRRSVFITKNIAKL